MQIRCYHCHKPFALSREAIHQALNNLMSAGLAHYNAYCPHCRRANRVSREELLHAAPDWTPPQQPGGQEEKAAVD
jgi:phage FluMu protein Com